MSARRFALASLTTVLLTLAVLTPFVSPVRAPAPPPFTTFGKATDSAGTALPVGTPIRTLIDGVDYSNLTSVFQADGSFQVETLGNWQTPATPEVKEGGDIGDNVMYAASDLSGTTSAAVFQQNATWGVGGFLNRSLMQSATQPALLKIQSLTTTPTDGGTQYAYLCNPTASSVDLTAFFLQKDRSGGYDGPTHALSGTVRAGGRAYVDLGAGFLTPTGDALKLVWTNPGGVGMPYSGSNVVVDRVEFNASAGGTLFWEPGNTAMTDAVAPGSGQEIHRNLACADTNKGSDFTAGTETGRLPQPAITVSYPVASSDFSGGTPHRIDWNMTSPYPDNTLVVNLSYSLDGISYTSIATGLTRTDPSTFAWTVPGGDSTTARVMVCARDLADILGCGTSPAFTIDSTRPTASSNPANGDRGVALNQVIILTFSEPMQPTPTDVTFFPSAGTPTYTWTDARTLEVRHSLFAGCQNYTVNATSAFLDASQPGNPLVPYSATFFTLCAPTLTFQAPLGGQDFTGGSTQSIRWFMTDSQPGNFLMTWVNLSTDSGATFPIPIDSAMRAKGNVVLSWIVNLLNTTTARVQVCVQNDIRETTCDDSPADFAIDSRAPTVTNTTPWNTYNEVLPGDTVTVTFSEPMNEATTVITLTPDPGGVSVAWNGAFTVATVNHAALSPAVGTYTLTVAGTSTDRSTPGNPIGSDVAVTFSLDTAPQVQILPSVNACWCGGSAQPIDVILDDRESGSQSLVVYVNYTESGGGGGAIWGPLTGLVGGLSRTWNSVPMDNDPALRIIVTAFDPRGLFTQQVGDPVRLDSARPTLRSATPSDGATGVRPDAAPIVLQFSETMNRRSVEGNITILPALTGVSFSWNANGDTLTIAHNPFAQGTPYTITLPAAVRDNCTPGNSIDPSPTTVAFSTIANNQPTAAFTSPGPSETWNAGDTHVIRWTITDESPASVLVWLNVTTSSGNRSLRAGVAGLTNWTWIVSSDLAGQTVTFHIDLVDNQGAHGSAVSLPVTIGQPGGGGGPLGILGDPFLWVIIIIVIVVVVALLLFLVMRRRKKGEEEAPPSKKPPTKPGGTPPAKAPPAAAPVEEEIAEEPVEEEAVEETAAEEPPAETEEVSPEELTPEDQTEEPPQ